MRLLQIIIGLIFILILIGGSFYFAYMDDQHLVAWMAGASFGGLVASIFLQLFKKSSND